MPASQTDRWQTMTGPACRPGQGSQIDLLWHLQGVVHLDAEVSDSALQLPVTQ